MYTKSVVHGTATLGARENTEVGDTRPTDRADLGGTSGFRFRLSVVKTRLLERQCLLKRETQASTDLSLSARLDVIFRDVKHGIRCPIYVSQEL